MGFLDALLAGLAPPRCAACGRSCRLQEVICPGCARRLAEAKPLCGKGPAGIDCAWSSAPHQGAARDLVTALKFRRLLPVAALMAERIDWLVPTALLGGAIVPVPTAARRTRGRGFDPASEIAAALCRLNGVPIHACLIRDGGGRQLGRSRTRRIADPPRIRARGDAPASVLLIDDVFTTGATLSACADALRRAGAERVVAVTFARRL
jgi:predicted amidophosphoribosyltransferase